MKHNLYRAVIAAFVLLLNINARAQIITTVVGQGPTMSGYSGDGGPATAAKLFRPSGVAFDGSGNYYIADWSNNVIRKVNALTGIITTVAGGTQGYSGDGGPASAAELNNPWGVTTDATGNFFIADYGNHVIRKVNAAGIITTIAGNGFGAGTLTGGFSGDGGPATDAELFFPFNVAIDHSGNIFFSDGFNNRIRKVDAAGIITTVAGGGTTLGDGGPATDAALSQPDQIVFDGAGNLLIAGWGQNRIRKISPAGIITTVAGSGTAGYSGDGGAATAAELYYPDGVCIDTAGNIFIGDSYNSVVRKVSPSGIITTVAGNNTSGYSGDGGTTTAAELGGFNSALTVAIDASGDLFIADLANNAVRKVHLTSTTGIQQFTSTNNNIFLFPNPNGGTFTIKGSLSASTNENALVEVRNMLGRVVDTHSIKAQKGIINAEISLNAALTTGIYLLHIIGATETNTLRFLIEK